MSDAMTNHSFENHTNSDSNSGQGNGLEAEIAQYLPHLGVMSGQLRETSALIEEAVVGVCSNFQGIAQRARDTVARATGFLSHEGGVSGGRSFEHVVESCGGTLIRVLNATEEAGEVSRRAIERIQQIDTVSQEVTGSLAHLDHIANGNRMLVLNARIEAAHAGIAGAGFAIVADEVGAQTQKSREVTAKVTERILDLRKLAGSAVEDLQYMTEQEHKRIAQSRREVDEALDDLRTVHDQLKTMLTEVMEESRLLANDVGSAVRGMQFQDRTSQRIAHVIEDLNIMRTKLSDRIGDVSALERPSTEAFSAYTMYEERRVAGIAIPESEPGDVELF